LAVSSCDALRLRAGAKCAPAFRKEVDCVPWATVLRREIRGVLLGGLAPKALFSRLRRKLALQKGGILQRKIEVHQFRVGQYSKCLCGN
jgi:hypothetical protein